MASTLNGLIDILVEFQGSLQHIGHEMKGFPHILFHEAPDGHEEVDEETVM